MLLLAAWGDEGTSYAKSLPAEFEIVSDVLRRLARSLGCCGHERSILRLERVDGQLCVPWCQDRSYSSYEMFVGIQYGLNLEPQFFSPETREIRDVSRRRLSHTNLGRADDGVLLSSWLTCIRSMTSKCFLRCSAKDLGR